MDVFDPSTGSGGGFDIVIGNPPYIEHKKLKDIAYLLKPHYKVYSGSADISVYFFELGFNLLKKKGILQYISSNKFFNTGYGKELRKYLLENTINHLVNFEQVEVFEGVLVSSVIFGGYKDLIKKSHSLTYTEFFQDENWKINFNEHLANSNKLILQKSLNESEWSFANDEAMIIKNKIESNGYKLKEIEGLDIKRGVTTGYDPAFIIDEETSHKLNDDIIKALLKGREIKKYSYLNSKQYLIFTRRGIDINKHKSVKEHLSKYISELTPRNDDSQKKGRKPGDYSWYEIQDNTAYYILFEEEKIIWPLTADKWGFAFDDKKHYLTSGGFFLVSENLSLKYILGILNSKVLEYYFKFIGVMTAGGAFTLKKATIEEFPIPDENDNLNKIEKLVNKVLDFKKDKLDSSKYENKIDALVLHLYNLTESEMLLVLDSYKDLSIKDRNQIQNEYWNIANNKFQLEI
jgi:hypothetical protein